MWVHTAKIINLHNTSKQYVVKHKKNMLRPVKVRAYNKKVNTFLTSIFIT